MYQDYFRLTALPFSIAPDPRFLYLSARHREAFAHLLFGVRGEGGFVLLTGEIGTGKTTLCRSLLDQIQNVCDVAYVLNPRMQAVELLASVCEELHIEVPPGIHGTKRLVDAINDHLLAANAAGRRAVLIIDEAQNLQTDVLEQLRLLTNLETSTRKLLQIILIGQPELLELLQRPEMRQVAQRIVARFHLTNLTATEVAAYVKHRLRISGTTVPLFPDKVIRRLYRLTGGVPRLINLVCDRALLGAYVQGEQQVTPRTLKMAAREVLGESAASRSWRRLALSLSLAGAVGGVFVGGYESFPRLFGTLSAAASQPPALTAPQHRPEPATASAPAASAPAPAAATVAAALPPRAEPPAPIELHWPVNAPRSISERLAFRDMFKLYGITYDPGSKMSPCEAAAAAQMRCLTGRGGLGELTLYDQPALLAIDGQHGEPGYHAVLTSLDGQDATFIVAGESFHVRVSDIAANWSGNFTLLWQAPPGFTDTLTPGKRGPAVSWLRQKLAAAMGGSAQGGSTFDDRLFRQIKAFQLAEGIVPDGAAGPLTMMRLNMRLDANLPRLTTTKALRKDVLHP